MEFVFLPIHILHLISLFIIVILLGNAWHHRWDGKSFYFFLYGLGLIVWVFFNFLETSAVEKQAKIVFVFIEYIGIAAVPVLYLLFIAQIFSRLQEMWKKIVILILPAVFLILIFTNSLHHLFFKELNMVVINGIPVLVSNWGPLFMIFAAHNYALVIFAFFLLIKYFPSAAKIRKKQVVLLFGAQAIPLTANFLFVFQVPAFNAIDLTAIVFTLSSLLIVVALYKYQLLEVIPYAKDRILDALNDIMLITDNEGYILYLNKLGKSSFELNAEITTFSGLLPEIPSEPFELEEFLKHNTLYDRYFSLKYTDILDKKNRNAARVYLLRDTTDRMLNTHALEKAKEEAEFANAEKTRFLATVSHEIRTPMNAIIGMAELTLDSELDDEQKSNIEIVKSSAESLSYLLNDILDYSRIDAGRMILEIVDFDMHSFLRDCTRTFYQAARLKNIQLMCDISPSMPKIVKGDYQRLRQVLINLLSNAIKFTEQGSISVVGEYVKTETDPLDNIIHKIRIIVKDTGVGIPPDKLHLIFKDFSQANSSVSRKYGGTGLGLAISQGIINIMDGDIEVNSKENIGTSFIITLKLPQGDKKKLVALGDKYEASDVDSLTGIFILLVEDNTVNINLARKYLQKYGHQVVTALSGEEALSELEHINPDLILMDIEMPGGIDGIETTRQIREREKNQSSKRVPIVGMSAYSQQEIIEQGKTVGMDDYITKPVNFRKLQDMINRIIEGHQILSSKDESREGEELLDFQKIISAVGFDPEFLEELIQNYISSSADYFKHIIEGVKVGDLQDLGRYAHSLAGSSLTLGADIVGNTCKELEDAAKNKKSEKVAELFPVLERQYKQVIAYCKKLNFNQSSFRKYWQ